MCASVNCNMLGSHKIMSKRKLQQGVPRQNIFDTIRKNVGNQILQEHLTDDQDIKNIKKSFGVDTVQRHQNDKDSAMKNGVKINISQRYFLS